MLWHCAGIVLALRILKGTCVWSRYQDPRSFHSTICSRKPAGGAAEHSGFTLSETTLTSWNSQVISTEASFSTYYFSSSLMSSVAICPECKQASHPFRKEVSLPSSEQASDSARDAARRQANKPASSNRSS